MTTANESASISKTILVTGLNGYIASHIAHLLLQKGYTVRGTSRRPTTLSTLLSQPAFTPYADSDRLQHVVVPDMTRPGAFDDAVRDVHAVIHVASPLDFKLRRVDAFFGPAVSGVRGILESCLGENQRRAAAGNRQNQSIQSFVLTSSIAAVIDRWRFPPVSAGGTENRAYTEADWNETGESVARESECAEREGTGTFLPMVAYGASKAAAERAMWEFAKSHTDNYVPACTSINPGVVTGPPVFWPASPDALNETLKPIWDIWSGAAKLSNALPPQIGGASYIDVRDVAALHVWVMEHPECAGGERYLATNGKAPPQAVADLLRDDGALEVGLFQEGDEESKRVRERIVVGRPGVGWVPGFMWPEDEPSAKATKAYEHMGVEGFRGFGESVWDTVMGFRERWPEFGY